MKLRNSHDSFVMMAKPCGPLCNLDCRYCYYLKKQGLFQDNDFRMNQNTLESFIRQYMDAQKVPELVFSWHGGEPTLMGLSFYQNVIELQQKYRKPGVRILNTIQTNGVMLDDAWCQFFKENNFLVGLSLDGPAHLHNAYRVDKVGEPSFERVMAGLFHLKQHHVDYNILTTVHKANVSFPIEVYRFLRDDVGVQFIQFIPIVERVNTSGNQEGYQISKRSVSGKAYGNFLISIFEEWVKQDVGKTFVQIFDAALAAWLGQSPGLCIFEETCGNALVIEHNGDIYACDHYVEPDYLLGNIQHTSLNEMVRTPQQIAFGTTKLDSLPKYCMECDVRFICNGGCPKDRIRRTPDGEAGLNILCSGYKAFFTHIDRPMRLMANLVRARQTPANIMELYKE